MPSNDETARLEAVAGAYAHADLAGVNEQYHVHLRDTLIPPGGGRSALELGCGKGLWTKVLCDRYDVVDVVDGSADLLRQVAERNVGRRARLTTHQSLVEDLPDGRDRQWQHIYITFLLEHVQRPVDVLRRIKSCLADDGQIFLAVPNARSVHRVVAHRMGLIEALDELSENDLRTGHRRVYTAELLRSHVLTAGYEIVAERSVGLKVLNLRQMEHWSADQVNAFCISGDLAPDNGAYLTLTARHPNRS
ncbi:MAG: methyltransferase domain-containing protein [Pirellulales bacterium]|nr:methyltransferase domain-containing protein [Pirellulales bacterium]